MVEIESLIGKLSELQSPDNSSAKNITKQISNWETVLENYRDHNIDRTKMFSAEDIVLNKIVNSFHAWQNGIVNDDDLYLIIRDSLNKAMFISAGAGDIKSIHDELTAENEEEAKDFNTVVSIYYI